MTFGCLSSEKFLVDMQLLAYYINIPTLQYVMNSPRNLCILSIEARRQLGYAPLVSPMRARALSMIHFDGRLDEFPVGKFKVDFDKYNYLDDGSDYTPDRKLQKKRSKAQYQTLTQIFSITAALAIVLLGSVLKF